MKSKLFVVFMLLATLSTTGASVVEARSSLEGSYRMPSSSYRTPSFKTPSIRNYSNGGSLRYQNGYLRSNGTYVQSHLKTSPDNTIYNNRKYQLGY